MIAADVTNPFGVNSSIKAKAMQIAQNPVRVL
jgi:hypothetical protein